MNKIEAKARERKDIASHELKLVAIQARGYSKLIAGLIMKRYNYQSSGNRTSSLLFETKNNLVVEGNTYKYVGFKAPEQIAENQTSNLIWTLPDTKGEEDNLLMRDDADGLKWGTIGDAQNAWSLDGNNISGDDKFLGTTNQKDLVFKTNDKERMILNKDGDLIIKNTDNIVGTEQNFKINIRQREGKKKDGTYSNIGFHYLSFQHLSSDIPGSFDDFDEFIYTSEGKVGIGNILDLTSFDNNYRFPNGYKLYVADGILTEKVKVAYRENKDEWKDFVFNKDYKLMSLTELEEFINKNKHLPDIPSAKEVEQERGFELGKMTTLLLQKVEELTLYIIQQNKQIEEQNQKIKELENKNK